MRDERHGKGPAPEGTTAEGTTSPAPPEEVLAPPPRAPGQPPRRSRALQLVEEVIRLGHAEGLAMEELTRVVGRTYAHRPDDIPRTTTALLLALFSWAESSGQRLLGPVDTAD